MHKERVFLASIFTPQQRWMNCHFLKLHRLGQHVTLVTNSRSAEHFFLGFQTDRQTAMPSTTMLYSSLCTQFRARWTNGIPCPLSIFSHNHWTAPCSVILSFLKILSFPQHWSKYQESQQVYFYFYLFLLLLKHWLPQRFKEDPPFFWDYIFVIVGF